MIIASTRCAIAALLLAAGAASAAGPAPVVENVSSMEAAAAKAAQMSKQAKESAARQPKIILAQSSYALEARGTVYHNETRLVYFGQSEKCYSLTFTQRTGVPGYPDSFTRTVISVFVNGQLVENLNNPGETTDVCGTKIQVKGWTPDQQGSMSWYALERRP